MGHAQDSAIRSELPDTALKFCKIGTAYELMRVLVLKGCFIGRARQLQVQHASILDLVLHWKRTRRSDLPTPRS